jgi:hypothetical protein
MLALVEVTGRRLSDPLSSILGVLVKVRITLSGNDQQALQ